MILQKYLQGYLIFDMINIIPPLALVFLDTETRAFAFILTLFRSFKMKRAAECFKIDLSALFANRRLISLVIFLGAVLILSHYVA